MFFHKSVEGSGRGFGAKGGVLMLMALAASLSTGCMQTPGDQQHVGSYQAPVDFGGLVGTANEPIDIQAWNYKSNSWMSIGDTVSDWLPEPGTDGDLFPWDISYEIPDPCWFFIGLDNPLGDFRAHVRAVVIDTGQVLECTGDTPYATIYGNYNP